MRNSKPVGPILYSAVNRVAQEKPEQAIPGGLTKLAGAMLGRRCILLGKGSLGDNERTKARRRPLGLSQGPQSTAHNFPELVNVAGGATSAAKSQ